MFDALIGTSLTPASGFHREDHEGADAAGTLQRMTWVVVAASENALRIQNVYNQWGKNIAADRLVFVGPETLDIPRGTRRLDVAPAWDVSKLVPALADLLHADHALDFVFICDDTTIVTPGDVAARLAMMNPELVVVYGRPSAAELCEGMEQFERYKNIINRES